MELLSNLKQIANYFSFRLAKFKNQLSPILIFSHLCLASYSYWLSFHSLAIVTLLRNFSQLRIRCSYFTHMLQLFTLLFHYNQLAIQLANYKILQFTLLDILSQLCINGFNQYIAMHYALQLQPAVSYPVCMDPAR